MVFQKKTQEDTTTIWKLQETSIIQVAFQISFFESHILNLQGH